MSVTQSRYKQLKTKIRSPLFKKIQNSFFMEANEDRKAQNKLLDMKLGHFMKEVVQFGVCIDRRLDFIINSVSECLMFLYLWPITLLQVKNPLGAKNPCINLPGVRMLVEETSMFQ